jgi:hypothetical protein
MALLGDWLPALLEVEGPDPKLAKATARAFHTALHGRTTLSASGLVQMLQFLSEDHETQMRYTAWRTARRLRGDRV